MDKTVLAFVNKLEGYKTAIKQLHWDAKNMSQHELCDDIAESIAEFQDTVSEVEQSISGKLKVNSLNPTEYKIKDLKSFVQDVLDATNTFYKAIKGKGDTYVGMASDCESFLSDMQRKLYLVNFTMKEDFKREFRKKINEAMYKRVDNPSKKSRSNVTTLKTRIKHIYDAIKEHGLDSRLYHDEAWQAIDFYHKVITDKFGGEVEVNTKPCADLRHADSIESDGGYCDYDPYDHMPRSKQYAIEIEFPDGMKVSGYIKCMAAGTVEDPFSSYDTCMVLWPKTNKVLENRVMRSKSINEDDFMRRWFDKNEEDHLEKARKELWDRDQKELNSLWSNSNGGKVEEGISRRNQIRLTEDELKQVVRKAAIRILNEVKLKTKYGEISLHGNNAYDWAELEKLRRDRASAVSKSIDKARQRGWKYREDGDEEKARQEFDSISSLNNVADKEFRNRFRNGKNAEDLGYKYRNLDNIEGDRFEKLKSIKAMMDRATSPEEKHKYYQMYCDIEGDLKGRADAELNQYLELKNKLGKK